jgi:twitching motility protein PilT
MDRLKSLLRVALSSKADRIKIQIGNAPEILVNGSSSPADNLVITENEFATFVKFLLPKEEENLQSGRNAKGVLNVPGIGSLQIIAIPAKASCLKMFLPPNGDALAAKEWNNLQAAPNRPAGIQLQSKSPPVKAAPAIVPNNTNIENNGLPQLEDAGGGGFIPPTFANTPELGDATGIHELPKASLKRSSPDIPSTPAPAIKFAAEPQVVPAPVLDQKFPESDDFAGMQNISVSIPNDVPTSNTGPVELFYEAEAPGDSSSSDGSNPIDPILIDMIDKGASDLHLTNSQPIVFRIDGDIARLEGGVIDSSKMRAFLEPIMPVKNKQELADTHDTDFAYEITGVGRFRVNIFRDRNGLGSVMRHIPETILTADQLGLSEAIRSLTHLSKGLVLVTGPTGSGKSTTLAAMIDLINKSRKEHILTIEDPIEFVHPQQECLVNQREISKHTDSFSRALKAALREDPDIVLIGEMRDLETVAIAIETAETGHLVFGTLHTTTATSTVDRIVDQFPADQQEQIRIMLSSSLKGVISQTLLKKIGGGRVAAHEILLVNDAVGAMIREGKTHMMLTHMQTQKKLGNQTLNECLLQLVKNKQITVESAVLKCIDKTGMKELLKRNQITVPDASAA